MAAALGHASLVKELLGKSDTDVHTSDINGTNALMWAAGNGKTNTVHVVLKDGRINASAEDAGGNTALLYAATYGYLDVVKEGAKIIFTGVQDSGIQVTFLFSPSEAFG